MTCFPVHQAPEKKKEQMLSRVNPFLDGAFCVSRKKKKKKNMCTVPYVLTV